jgi:ribosomal protein S27E
MTNNNFEPTRCPDCDYNPNFSVIQLKDSNNEIFYSIKCRDCGDTWEEYEKSASENFLDLDDLDDD